MTMMNDTKTVEHLVCTDFTAHGRDVAQGAEAGQRGELPGDAEEAPRADGEGVPAGVPEPTRRDHRLPSAHPRGPEGDREHEQLKTALSE